MFRLDRATYLLALPIFSFYREEGKEVDFNCITLSVESRQTPNNTSIMFGAVILEGITGTGLLSLPKMHKHLSEWNKRVKHRTPANKREKG